MENTGYSEIITTSIREFFWSKGRKPRTEEDIGKDDTKVLEKNVIKPDLSRQQAK